MVPFFVWITVSCVISIQSPLADKWALYLGRGAYRVVASNTFFLLCGSCCEKPHASSVSCKLRLLCLPADNVYWCLTFLFRLFMFQMIVFLVVASISAVVMCWVGYYTIFFIPIVADLKTPTKRSQQLFRCMTLWWRPGLTGETIWKTSSPENGRGTEFLMHCIFCIF